ncbi:MAG: hypothetical protein MZV63_30600 [Marinilabiliales bacterium]|nr:hypothetical protein [Marinilabiliales bacterium]
MEALDRQSKYSGRSKLYEVEFYGFFMEKTVHHTTQALPTVFYAHSCRMSAKASSRNQNITTARIGHSTFTILGPGSEDAATSDAVDHTLDQPDEHKWKKTASAILR